jgi:hypothetical protein
MALKVFTCINFKGHYPVGVCAIVAAETADDAAMILNCNLAVNGLDQGNRWMEASDMVEFKFDKIEVEILLDGNY